MKRSEKPEGYRQMRPKTFPASNYTGSSQQMLQEIRESLRNLPKPSDAAKADHSMGKMSSEDPRQGRNPPKFVTYHKVLQEIRNSLLPFANETTSAVKGTSEVNRQMLQDLQAAGFDEDMVIQALRQTNNRSIEAAIEFISKMSYQDPRREQMVAAAARPVNAGMKPPGTVQQSVNRKQSWKGSKESLVPQRHGPSLGDGVVYRSESPSSQPDVGRPLSGSGIAAFAQAHPPPMNPPAMNSSGQGQRGMSAVPIGRQPIIMQSSANSKFSFPSGRAGMQNGNCQAEFMVHQNVVSGNSVSRQPPPYPINPTNRQSPTALQMQAGGSAPPSAYTNGNIPQTMMVPNRNSHNMELYNTNVAGIPASWPQPPPVQPQSSPGNGHEIPTWQPNVPVRSNSFNNHHGNRQSHSSSSQPSATTVTAITPAPIQQPVKSMRVLKPELQTALAPTHPSWMPQPVQTVQTIPFSESPSTNMAVMAPVAEAPNYQGPPPPYPKHLLHQSPSVHPYEAGPKLNKEEPPILSVPVRKNKKDEERRESRIQSYSPQAFKFFMEQHVENILKSHQQRLHRKKQLSVL